MPAPNLRHISSFATLIRYLEDELNWPLDGLGMEDVTFEFDAEKDLQLKADDAAQVRSIRQLRPLTAKQPWGIFFIEFDRKKLPVVVLRRILSYLVIKKRASANKADRAAWSPQDLLFVSAFGPEGADGREIGFAHFHKDPDTTELPILRVLGWEASDRPLKIERVASVLRERLCWPENPNDSKSWRKTWSSAFRNRPGHVIRTAKELAATLAQFAKRVKQAARTVMAYETESGRLKQLHRAFREALIHDLSEDDFATYYAETICYGLFSVAVSKTELSEGRYGTAIAAEDVAHFVPITNPFLQKIIWSFLEAGGRSPSIDFDELGIQEIVAFLNGNETDLPAILVDFGNVRPGLDPVIHLYEDFLQQFDADLRKKRGVYYTPQPVVSYIVCSVHEQMRTEFGLTDGLADTTTWGEMLEKHPDLKLPPLTDEPGERRVISPDEPFVQILDPATGTATFLVEVVDVIHRTMKAKWQSQRFSEAQQRDAWNDYVPLHLLPRLHAFELMMAPYAIAHMKIGLKLAETGYRFGTEERARIYLTNALEPWVKQLPLIGFDALAHEAAAVNEIKRHKRFTVVIGNPPYAKSSGNRSATAEMLVQTYKDMVSGETNVQPLSDDYVKFIAYSLKTTASDSSVIGMITNRSFLNGLIHRGMRKTLLSSCSTIFITDLHGDSNVGENVPAGRSNDNVFDITQGVAISVFVRKPHSLPLQSIFHTDIWGTRTEKFDSLKSASFTSNSRLVTADPYFFFTPKDLASQAEQVGWVSVDKFFVIAGMGVKSRRDHFLIDQERDALQNRFHALVAAKDIEIARVNLSVTDNEQWTLGKMQNLVKRVGVESGICPILYRPFDTHHIWYHREAIERGDSRWPVMKHVLPDRLSLLTSRQSTNADFTSVFVSRGLSEMKTAESTRGSYAFPIFTVPNQNDLVLLGQHGTNMRLELLAPHLRKRNPLEILGYIYAVLYSPAYRLRYAGALCIEFPKVPASCDDVLFDKLSKLGSELVALHLLESPKLGKLHTEFIGSSKEVTKIGYADNTVWINSSGTKGNTTAGTSGFRGVPVAVWNFHIGGYQVCDKWLKDRRGRTLTQDDIAHYHKIVVALTETIRLMQEIDEVIDAHGGWPGAFAAKETKKI